MTCHRFLYPVLLGIIEAGGIDIPVSAGALQ